MDTPEDYKKLITEIVHKQMDILGPEIAIKRARNVSGIEISEQGDVTAIGADPQAILQKLVNEYVTLSGDIVKNILGPVLAKYPEIKLDLK